VHGSTLLSFGIVRACQMVEAMREIERKLNVM
jgi:hypothetical protein